MNFVLDTNAVSETRKRQPNAGVLQWLSIQERATLFVTTVTLAEAWHGLHRLPPEAPDYQSVKRFVSGLPEQYRILNFDRQSAQI